MEKVNNIPQTEWHNSQRGFFFGALHDEMIANLDMFVVTADLGFGMLTNISKDFSDRIINVGAAEMCAVDVAIGLALEGKRPFVYTISSFYMRAAEPIALYLDHEKIPVVLVGGGRDGDYKDDGVSHHARYTQTFMDTLKIKKFYPYTNDEAGRTVKEVLQLNSPCFVSLRR